MIPNIKPQKYGPRRPRNGAGGLPLVGRSPAQPWHEAHFLAMDQTLPTEPGEEHRIAAALAIATAALAGFHWSDPNTGEIAADTLVEHAFTGTRGAAAMTAENVSIRRGWRIADIGDAIWPNDVFEKLEAQLAIIHDGMGVTISIFRPRNGGSPEITVSKGFLHLSTLGGVINWGQFNGNWWGID